MEKEILDLRETVRLLIAENEMLAERAEDTLLLGLIAEQMNLTSEANQVITVTLEQIGMLKDLPVCIFCLIQPQGILIESGYLSFSEQQIADTQIPLDPALAALLPDGAHLFQVGHTNSATPVDDWITFLEQLGFLAKTLLVVPFKQQDNSTGFFLFADNQPEDRLSDMLLMLNRVVEMVVDRRNNLYLMQALNRSNTQLQAMVAELEAFSYSISHDLRAPLRSINGYATIVLETYEHQLAQDARDQLQRIQESARRMGRLIDDLLQFSRLGRKPLARLPVDLSALAAQVWQEMIPDCANRQVELLLGDLPDCQGDPTLLRQVLVNLLSNALKFTRTRPVARIELGYTHTLPHNAPVKGNSGAYFVGDNGVGFDTRYAEKLFGVFQRLHRDEDYEGTGVGLAIAQRILLRHGGLIWADSILDQGATFYFMIDRP